MTSQNLSRNSEILQKYDYSYGQLDVNEDVDANKNNGQLAQIVSYIGTQKQWTQKFKYDSIGRFSEAKEFRGDNENLTYRQKFDYDRFGNLYRKNASNPVTGQEHPLPFTPIEDSDISKATNRFTTNTQYDDAGNVIQDTKYRNQNFWYDANGRMYKTASTLSSNQSSAVYDALGQRVGTQVDGVWTFLIYDAFGKLVAEYGGLQSTDEGGVKFVLQDWQGSSRAILSQSGYVQTRIDYQAFGEEINSGIGLRTAQQGYGANNNLSQKYALTERDKSTGLDHTLWRKLENQAGRWTSPDPYRGSSFISSPQSWNRYSYVANEPTNFVDPTGLLRISQCTRYWYSDGNGNVYYTPWFCTVIYDDGGGAGGAGSSPLSPRDQKRFDKQKDKLLKKGISPKCAKFLEKLGTNAADVLRAIRAQQAFEGRTSTISVRDAGIRDFGAPGVNPSDPSYNIPVSDDFRVVPGRPKTLAATGVAPGGVPGATIEDRSNVYYRGSSGAWIFRNWNGLSAQYIFHEAIHSATGLGDRRLVEQAGITPKPGESNAQALQRSLKENDCI